MTSNASRSEQVRAESALGCEPRQVLVRRRDDADVGAQRALAADTLELAVFDHPQQLLLHQPGGVRQLVQEQRAAVGALETALVRARRAGEGAGFVAEQLVLDQCIADRRAVELEELVAPALRKIVQARGDQFLARAALAHYQHRLVQRCHLGDGLQCRQEGGRFADQAFLLLRSRHGPQTRFPGWRFCQQLVVSATAYTVSAICRYASVVFSMAYVMIAKVGTESER